MTFVYALLSVLVVSAVSLIGIITFGLKLKFLQKILLLLVSFSAGALFGDAFFHLLPEAIEPNGLTLFVSLSLLGGILFGLITEKVIRRNHCHMPITKNHTHPVATMNLVGDVVHNLIDGLIIGSSYLVNIPLGVATTIAVLFHEIPQEIGDFGVLVHGGYSRKKALLMNFLTALTAVLGVIIVFLLSSYVNNMIGFLIPFAAGSFIYIAGSDLIPELHKETKISQTLIQILFFLIGLGLMASLLLFE